MKLTLRILGVLLIARAFVTQVHLHALHRHKLRRRWRPACLERFHAAVRGPSGNDSRNRKNQNSDEQNAQDTQGEFQNISFLIGW